MTGTATARPVPVTGDSFRDALARHAAGVVVVTARPDGATPEGLTATSFTSVSLDPPLVSFYVAGSSTTFPRLRRAATFAVNVLRHDQADLAARFASRDVDRFAEPTRWRPGPQGEPLLDGVAVRLRCAWHSVREIGDHLLVVGHVTGVELGADDDLPLLYHRGRFGRFTAHRRHR
ncbi:Flavin-dependent monooxygenase, reductase subunit HsaB [Actinomadura rubteroloni]|uniref:Flavin-dependent monooxygenase, reductase subunit HsaB n=1 Tax=Actinomadura rubteroloni TaxID=1926885 RepID=A0A2P4URT6_9ACTN|nr:flavin reductase family protein [Actinomadura rubteroloni]POM27757.1 Flavin-dependent monooxygenase, reductase subunit HsaB [Actinomadura rubteroloni]